MELYALEQNNPEPSKKVLHLSSHALSACPLLPYSNGDHYSHKTAMIGQQRRYSRARASLIRQFDSRNSWPLSPYQFRSNSRNCVSEVKADQAYTLVYHYDYFLLFLPPYYFFSDQLLLQPLISMLFLLLRISIPEWVFLNSYYVDTFSNAIEYSAY